MYKIAEHNESEILKSIDNSTAYTNYCDLNIVYNELDYKFCMGECALEGCTGQYHTFTTEVIQEEQEIQTGVDEFDNPIYGMQMVDVDAYTHLIEITDILAIEDYKVNLLKPQTLSEIKIAIDLLKHSKSEWFDYDNHYQRFLDSDERKIEAAIKGLTVQPLFENVVDEFGNITGTVPKLDESEVQIEGKIVESIEWKYPTRDEFGVPVEGENDYVVVSDRNYFFLMQARGNLHGNVCFGAEKLTRIDLETLVESGGDLSAFDYEVIFNGHYDGLVAQYL